MKENIKEKSLLVEFINKFYVLIKINILSLIFLVLGLGFITFSTVIKAALFEINELQNGNIDAYSSLKKSYMNIFLKEMRKIKKNIFLELTLLWLVCTSIIMRSINSRVMTIVNILIIYIIFMIIIYSSYSQMLNNKLEALNMNCATRIEKLSFQFFKMNKLIYSILLLLAIVAASIRLPILVLVLSFSIYGYIFYKLNLSNLDEFISILQLKKGKCNK